MRSSHCLTVCLLTTLLGLNTVSAQQVEPTPADDAKMRQISRMLWDLRQSLVPLLSLAEMFSFGTTASSDQLRDGVQVNILEPSWNYGNGQIGCRLNLRVQLTDVTHYVELTPPVTVSQTGQFLRIDSQHPRGIESREEGSNKPVTRGRVLLRFGFADDVAKLTALLGEFAQCAPR